jgi:hypothetical protein
VLPIIKEIAKQIPEVWEHLSNRARFVLYHPVEYKTVEYMLRSIEGLVRGVYTGTVRGQFIDTMANLISGQLRQAYQQAYEDEGFTNAFLPDYLEQSLQEAVLNQYGFVDQYYRDIIDASLDGTPIAPLIARAKLWAQRWTEAYNEAVRLITIKEGGNLEWKLGATEEHCPECAALNGIVARATEWNTLGVRPQNAPNKHLTCGGWKCDCTLTPTKKRRSPNAYGRIEEILLAR